MLDSSDNKLKSAIVNMVRKLKEKGDTMNKNRVFCEKIEPVL
jgi:hypothetical protein